jgi:hypothetical protein
MKIKERRANAIASVDWAVGLSGRQKAIHVAYMNQCARQKTVCTTVMARRGKAFKQGLHVQ